jgi:DNA-binding phage protein
MFMAVFYPYGQRNASIIFHVELDEKQGRCDVEIMGFYEDLQNVILSQYGPGKRYDNMNQLASDLGLNSTDLKRAAGMDETRENRSIKRLAKILDRLGYTITPCGQVVGDKQLETLRNEITARVTSACLSAPIDPNIKVSIISAASGTPIAEEDRYSSQKAAGDR